jgi:hypothetical protein
VRLLRICLLLVRGFLVPSRADVDQLVELNRTVRELITRDLQEFWNSLDLSSPAIARDALLEYMPVLVDQYGDVTATVAADWYAEIRSQAGAPGKFSPALAKNMDPKYVTDGTRSSFAGLFTGNPLDTLALLTTKAGKYAAQSGRNTIIQSAHRDPWKPRVARVPTGATTCIFCLTMASRGAIYASLQTAGKWNKYHGKCDCQAVVVGPGEDLPEDYNPGELYEQYLAGKEKAGSGALSEILSSMREINGRN